MTRLALVVPIISLFFVPSLAIADTAAGQTTQLLPPGGQTCTALTIISATPYTSGPMLESFDLIIADPSYVSVAASVGEVSVPLRHMSRWPQQNGSLKIHFDVPETTVGSGLPVTVTLLSSPSGRPTCLSTVSFMVPREGNAGSGPASGATTSSGRGAGSKTSASGAPAAPSAWRAPHTSAAPGAKATSSSASSSGGASIVSPVFAASLSDRVHGFCTSTTSYEMWFVLLAIYLVIVALTALSNPPLYERAQALPLASILIPLVLFVGFWYFAPMCRAATWIPLVLVVAAIVGLLVTYRERAVAANVIHLPAAAKNPVKK